MMDLRGLHQVARVAWAQREDHDFLYPSHRQQPSHGEGFRGLRLELGSPPVRIQRRRQDHRAGGAHLRRAVKI